jgi:hypothetical protein
MNGKLADAKGKEEVGQRQSVKRDDCAGLSELSTMWL